MDLYVVVVVVYVGSIVNPTVPPSFWDLGESKNCPRTRSSAHPLTIADSDGQNTIILSHTKPWLRSVGPVENMPNDIRRGTACCLTGAA